MPPVVSVILPCYRRAEKLRNAIGSVLAQCFRDLELIVVDDGSPDSLESVALESGDERVVFVRRAANGGAAAARNAGLARARGRYIAFQDSDDLWLPGKLARQVDLLKGLPAEVGAVTGPKILYGMNPDYVRGPDRVTLAPPPAGRLRLEQDQLKAMLLQNRISLQNSLFRREVFDRTGHFDEQAAANEDWEFAIRLAKVAKVFEDIRPVVVAFVSADSISSDPRRELMGVLRLLRNNRDTLAHYPAERAKLSVGVGRQLSSVGKRRLGRRLIAHAVIGYPWVVFGMSGAVWRRLAHRGARSLTAVAAGA
jgi:glycosyltransferase involved in cell wall biosynthesis